jgi:hypothetical protein
MPTTETATINADLLAFIIGAVKPKSLWVLVGHYELWIKSIREISERGIQLMS